MSYILDALRKAEPELADGPSIPQPVLVPPQFAEPRPQRLWYLALALTASALLISLLALWRAPAAQPAAALAPAAAVAEPAPAAALSPATAPAEPQADSTKPAVMVVGRVAPAVHEPLDWPPRSSNQAATEAEAEELPLSLDEVQLAGASLDEQLPDFSADVAPQQLAAAARTELRSTPALPAVEKLEAQPLTGDLLAQQFAAAVAATAPAQLQPAAPLGELPQAFQQRVPPLAFSQHLYSSDAANRWVRVNGRDAREGDKIAPDLLLERIEPQQVVLSLGGQRFALPALGDWR